jgi:hypothetical protein
MDPGTIRLTQSLGDLLAAGQGVMHCQFQPRHAGPARRVLEQGPGRPAFHCPECSTVLLTSDEALDDREKRLERERWIGREGVAATDLRPYGKVLFGGESVDARTEQAVILAGRPVVCIDLHKGIPIVPVVRERPE